MSRMRRSGTYRACLLVVASMSWATTAVSDDDIEMFAQQPIMVGARLSPDGTQIAFLSSLQGRYQVVIERFKPDFQRFILHPGDDLEFDWVRWVNNERLVLSASYSARRRQTETTETRIFSIDQYAQDLTVLVMPAKIKEVGSRIAKDMPPAQIQDRIVSWLPNEPNHILVALDSDHNGFDELRKIDVRNGEYETILNNIGGRFDWIADPAGEVRIGWRYDNDDIVITTPDADGNWLDTKSRGWSKAGFVPIAIGDDPDTALVVGPNEAGRYIIRRLNLASDELLKVVFEHESVDVDGVVVDDSSNKTVGAAFTVHLPAVEYFDEVMRKLQASIDRALPGATNRIVSTSAGRRQILVYSKTDDHPGSFLLWDRDEKALSEYSGVFKHFSSDAISPVRPVSFEARDGMVIPAYLTIPNGADAGSLPAVVLPHGGPHDRDDQRYWYVSQFLASRGYAILQPNFRGSSGYGKPFADAGLKEWGGKMQDDVTDGAQWMVREGIADPDRVCIVGWSYGGYSAAMGAVLTPDLYRCAVSINGVLDLPYQIMDDHKYAGGSEWTEHMGLDGETARSVSPYHQAERIKAPMLIIQAEDDTRVHKEQGRRMTERLEKLGKTVEYVEIEFGGHSMQNVAARVKILESLDRFLSANIGSHPAAD